MNNEELFEPEWFPDWFSRLFVRETYPPSLVIRKLNLQKDRVYKAMYTGELDALKTNGRWFIPRPALKSWLLKCYTLNLPYKH